ncbi:hypothetical protein H0H92_011840, partial [Tricholoma furcatifolium]
STASITSPYISTSLDILAGKDLSEIGFSDWDRGTSESSEDLRDHDNESVSDHDVQDHEFNHGGPATRNRDRSIVLGLRVYTDKGSPVTIASQLRRQF